MLVSSNSQLSSCFEWCFPLIVYDIAAHWGCQQLFASWRGRKSSQQPGIVSCPLLCHKGSTHERVFLDSLLDAEATQASRGLVQPEKAVGQAQLCPPPGVQISALVLYVQVLNTCIVLSAKCILRRLQQYSVFD